MTGVTYAKGVTAASLAAGPLFVLPMVVLGIARGWSSGAGEMIAAPFVLIVTIPFGLILSLLPNALGATLLARAGRGNVGLRFWPVWAMTGAGFGWALDGWVALGNGQSDAPPMFAYIGTACALICRWGTRWAD